MILTVTLNAALDVTYRIDPTAPAGRQPGACHGRAGGRQGRQRRRVLHALGHPTVVTGLVGGLTGRAILGELAAAGVLVDCGAGAVVASLGPDGLIAVTPQTSWRATPPERLAGNPGGADDAAVAALTLGLVHATPWPERPTEAVALSAAVVRALLADDFDPDVRRRLRPLVALPPLHPQRSS